MEDKDVLRVLEQANFKFLEQRFEDFKKEIFRGFADIKDTLGGRLSELSGEVKAYTQISQKQERSIVELQTRSRAMEDDLRELRPKVDGQQDQIIALRAELDTTRHSTKLGLTLVSIFLTVLSLILRYWGAR